ncbi:MAG: hypothetical protein ABIP17_12740 [Ilumatobacteraceae bacterium]
MTNTAPRWIGAVGALVAAYAHISLYQDGYKDIPIANIGTQFLLNALGGIAIAIALIAPTFLSSLPPWTTRAAAAIGIAWSAVSLLAYVLSHSDRGWMGYNDGPAFFQPAPEGALTVFSEAAVLIACVVLLAFPTVIGRRGVNDG